MLIHNKTQYIYIYIYNNILFTVFHFIVYKHYMPQMAEHIPTLRVENGK